MLIQLSDWFVPAFTFGGAVLLVIFTIEVAVQPFVGSVVVNVKVPAWLTVGFEVLTPSVI